MPFSDIMLNPDDEEPSVSVSTREDFSNEWRINDVCDYYVFDNVDT